MQGIELLIFVIFSGPTSEIFPPEVGLKVKKNSVGLRAKLFSVPTSKNFIAEVGPNVSHSYLRPWLNIDVLQGANPVDIDWLPAGFEGRGVLIG